MPAGPWTWSGRSTEGQWSADRRTLTFAITVLMTGCAAHADVGRRSWRELRSERVVMVTDVEGDVARERVREIDQLGTALSEIYAAILSRPPARVRPVRVVHLADCDELTRRFGENAAGAVTRSLDFERERLIVTCEIGDGLRNEVLLHELTHDLNHRYFSDLPAWLQEGLATYYQTLRLQDGKAVVGLRPRMDRSFWQGVAILPSMRELRAMSEEELVARGRRGYFAAWKLTHLLANGTPDYNRRFRGMLAGFGKVQRKGDAFAAAFGDIEAQLASEYGTYHLRIETNTWTLAYRESAPGIRGERVLRAGEALAVFLELEESPGERATPERVLRDALLRVERADPTWPGRLYWRAVVESRLGGGNNVAADLLRRFLAEEPNDPRGWSGLIELEMARLVPASHLGVEPGAPAGLDQLEDEVRELIRVGSSPAQLNGIAWYFALRRQPKIGFNFAMRAIQLEPGFADCWDTLALLYYQLDRPADAVFAQRRAIALMAESARGAPPAVEARMRHYERAAAERDRRPPL